MLQPWTRGVRRLMRALFCDLGSPHVPPGTKLTFSFSVVWFLAVVAFIIQPTNLLGPLSLALSLLFLLVFIVSLVRVFTQWRTYRLWAAVPFATCLIFLLTARPVGWMANSALFFRWRLPRYEAVIQKIESGIILVSAERQIVPAADYDSNLAYFVTAGRDTNGVLTVSFTYGWAGPPPYHAAFLYSSSGLIESGSYFDKHWPYRRKLQDKWFSVTD